MRPHFIVVAQPHDIVPAQAFTITAFLIGQVIVVLEVVFNSRHNKTTGFL